MKQVTLSEHLPLSIFIGWRLFSALAALQYNCELLQMKRGGRPLRVAKIFHHVNIGRFLVLPLEDPSRTPIQ